MLQKKPQLRHTTHTHTHVIRQAKNKLHSKRIKTFLEKRKHALEKMPLTVN